MAKPTKELYVINFIESGEIRSSHLGLGHAKNSFSHINKNIQPLLEISKFVRAESIISGVELAEKQKQGKEERSKKRQEAWAKYRLEQAQKDLEKAQEQLKKLGDS